MIRLAIGFILIIAGLFQADPTSKWGIILLGVLLMMWDGVDSNGEKLDTVLSNQRIIDEDIKKKE